MPSREWILVVEYNNCCVRRVNMVTDMVDGGASMRHVVSVGGWTTSRMVEKVYGRNKYAERVARYRKAALPRRVVNGDRLGTVIR